MCRLRLRIELWLWRGQFGERLDFIELRLHRVRHCAGSGTRHSYIRPPPEAFSLFPGERRRPASGELALDPLESDGNASIDKQGAANVNFRRAR